MYLQSTVRINKAYCASIEVVDEIAKLIRCGKLGIKGYPNVSKNVAEATIELRRTQFRELLAKAQSSPPAVPRVVEVSAQQGDAPAGIIGAALPMEDSPEVAMQGKRGRVEPGDLEMAKRMREEVDSLHGSFSNLPNFAMKTMEGMQIAAKEAVNLLETTKEFLSVKTKEKELEEKHYDTMQAKEDTRRAKELKWLKDEALAKAEAIMIVKRAEMGTDQPVVAQPVADLYPDVATFLPDDHTTVKKFYESTYPKYKPRLKKDERSFLNEAQTRARQAYQTEMGRPPLKVREEARVVDMFPIVWNGVVEALAGIHREREGFGQRSILSFSIQLPA